MISRAVYVACDVCHSPAEVTTTGGAQEARRIAKLQGFVRTETRDLCPAHAPDRERAR